MKRAAQSAPIWIIAVMGHVLLAAVLGMVYVRYEPRTVVHEPVAILAPSAPAEPKLEDEGVVIELPRDSIPRLDSEPDPSEIRSKLPPTSPDAPKPGPPEVATPGGAIPSDGQGPESDFPRIGMGTSGTAHPAILPGGGGGPSSRFVRLTAQTASFPKAEPTVRGGLRWLQEHQSDEGFWSSDGFHRKCDPKRGGECDGRGAAGFDVGVTGLALLAFFGGGCDGRGKTPDDETVRKALKWLRSVQDAEGCFGPRGDRFTYSHACATIAMCEAATFNKAPAWKKSAQAAIEFIERCQTPHKGWRYGTQPADSDVSVTGWMLLALKAGKDAGITVSERAMRDGLALLDALTEETTGRTGYLQRGDLPVRPQGFVDRWPARESESLTAVAACARIFCDATESPRLKEAQSLLAKKPPVWDVAAGTIDMYYWYYGTLAMHQLGGTPWDEWNKSLEKAVIQSQIKQGCAEGSWDPKDPWGLEGGRVYSTALMTLCFEVYWRYPFVFGGRK